MFTNQHFLKKYTIYINIFQIIAIYLLCCSLWGCGLSQEQITQREEYMHRAQQYYLNKHYRHSLQQSELALEIDPVCKRAILSKGWNLFFLKKYEDAEQTFLQAQKLDDSDPWMHYGLGAVYYKNAMKSGVRIETALKQFAESDVTEDDVEEWDQRLAGERNQKEQWLDKSKHHLSKALSIVVDNSDLYKMLAMTYAARGNTQYLQAIDYMDKYIVLLEKEFLGYQDLKKKPEQERKTLDISAEKKESLDNSLEYINKKIEDNRKNFKIAQTISADWCYQLAIQARADFNSATDPKVKAQYHKQMSKYANDAVERLELLLKSAPEMSAHYRNLSKITALLGQYQEAIHYLKEYLEKYPLADPKERVAVRLELQDLEQKIK